MLGVFTSCWIILRHKIHPLFLASYCNNDGAAFSSRSINYRCSRRKISCSQLDSAKVTQFDSLFCYLGISAESKYLV